MVITMVFRVKVSGVGVDELCCLKKGCLNGANFAVGADSISALVGISPDMGRVDMESIPTNLRFYMMCVTAIDLILSEF